LQTCEAKIENRWKTKKTQNPKETTKKSGKHKSKKKTENNMPL
jgi:hypothetical protein